MYATIYLSPSNLHFMLMSAVFGYLFCYSLPFTTCPLERKALTETLLQSEGCMSKNIRQKKENDIFPSETLQVRIVAVTDSA